LSVPANSHALPDSIRDVEYEALESALLQTTRGRAFLGEFSRRNRQSDTMAVLAAIEKLEGAMRKHAPNEEVERFRGDVLEMANRISDTRSQIASIGADDANSGAISLAKGELDAIVQSTQAATDRILEMAEEIQEIAWTLREGGFPIETCDAIDQRATNIYLACSFQDLTAQRTRKVTDAMQFLEARISRMIDIWGFSRDELSVPAEPITMLHGPTDSGLKQDEVDAAFHLNAAKIAGASPESFPELSVVDVDDLFDSTEIDEAVIEPSPEPPLVAPATDAVLEAPAPAMDAEIITLPSATIAPIEVTQPAAPKSTEDELATLGGKLAGLDALPARQRIAEFE
jgi:chemotaxis protein CheZ